MTTRMNCGWLYCHTDYKYNIESNIVREKAGSEVIWVKVVLFKKFRSLEKCKKIVHIWDFNVSAVGHELDV